MVTEDKWASGAPLGFAAFAMITLMLGLQFWDASQGERTSDFSICLAGGIAQILAGMVELKRGVGVRGNLLATMGCLFMLAPGVSFLVVSLKLGSPVPILGYLNMMLGMFMGIWGLPFLKAPKFVFFISPLGFVILFSIGLARPAITSSRPWRPGRRAWPWSGVSYVAHSLGEFVGIYLPLGKPLVSGTPAPAHALKESVSAAGVVLT